MRAVCAVGTAERGSFNMRAREYLQREIKQTELGIEAAAKKPNSEQEIAGLQSKLDALNEALVCVEVVQQARPYLG